MACARSARSSARARMRLENALPLARKIGDVSFYNEVLILDHKRGSYLGGTCLLHFGRNKTNLSMSYLWVLGGGLARAASQFDAHDRPPQSRATDPLSG